MAKRTKKQQPRSLIGIILVLLIAAGFAYFTGNVPEEIQESLPPEIRNILFQPTPTPTPEPTPEPTVTPRALPTPTPDAFSSEPAMGLPKGEGNTRIDRFDESKDLLMGMHLKAGQLTTFYCGSIFDAEKLIDHSASGYIPQDVTRYRFKQSSFDALAKKDVPSSLIEKLAPLKEHKFDSEQAFLDAIKEYVSGDDIDTYGELLLQYGAYRNRNFYLEWEHVVPAHAFGQSFVEWREGHPDCVKSNGKTYKGRSCAEKTSEPFQLMEADLYNLRPAIGEVNGDRSNYDYAMIDGEQRKYGACNMEIEGSKAEPPDNRFGDIARTYFYMESAYPGHGIVSNADEKLLASWDAMDPVDAWECERYRLIKEIQGNENLILKAACEEAGL